MYIIRRMPAGLKERNGIRAQARAELHPKTGISQQAQNEIRWITRLGLGTVLQKQVLGVQLDEIVRKPELALIGLTLPTTTSAFETKNSNTIDE
jgi:hypothetical protein